MKENNTNEQQNDSQETESQITDDIKKTLGESSYAGEEGKTPADSEMIGDILRNKKAGSEPDIKSDKSDDKTKSDKKETSKEKQLDQSGEDGKEAEKSPSDGELEQFDSDIKNAIVELGIDKDPSLKKELLEILPNFKNFTVSSTNRSKEAAQLKKEVEAAIEKLGTKAVDEALKAIGEHEDTDDILKATDEYFDEGNNPFRTLINTLSGTKKDREEHTLQRQKDLERQQELDFREQLINLKGLDSKYNDDQQVIDLIKSVDKLYEDRGIVLDLVTAHELSQGKQLAAELDKIQKENDKLKSQNAKLTEKLEKTPQLKTTAGASGGGSNEGYQSGSGIPQTFEEAEEQAKRELGVED